MCHLILFFPAFALPLFWVLPFEEALFYYLAVLGISFFLYFKIFQAMRQKVRTGLDGMVGERVVVVEDINPDGRIHYFSEIWGATTKGKKIFQGQQVKVVGMDGLMLIVEGVSKDQT